MLDLTTNELIQRYQAYPVAPLSYATVRDFCDSMDFLRSLSTINNDLKDAQRPWMVKAILSKVPVGSRLLEVGAGDPHVASVLSKVGYDVTIVDPYDGTGNGPEAYEAISQQFPHITFVRDFLTPRSEGLLEKSYDCVYSISVLEHVPDDDLLELFEGVRKFAKESATSIHAIDHVMLGAGADSHLSKLKIMVTEAGLDVADLENILSEARDDVETYFLSAEGHNMWRGNLPYDEFPMRRCISVQMCA